ncbi:group I truncated hemoglobin [Idiomarina sp. UBA4520]|jgi:hemoglobin|uniref:group I truncated hemoglobin n=1 Tax=Idiomarina sp. UBA4520 TaxID=1946647 RepID=UPI000B00DF9A|nr:MULTISPECIES: group 1 truncated hemoglobin [unclassified Idiomarina]|tara:strand:+ start:6301 stop:6708 length:408 start_codon:yes stop_codon:yes gene_type:complete
MRILSFVFLLLLSPVVLGQSLYQQLGEKEGISSIVEEMLYRVGGDERIVHHFDGVDIVRVHKLITEQVCDVVGGPCDYSGDTMKVSHEGMGVTHADFNALVEHLIIAMAKHNIPVSAQNQLLAKLAPVYGDIVEK